MIGSIVVAKRVLPRAASRPSLTRLIRHRQPTIQRHLSSSSSIDPSVSAFLKDSGIDEHLHAAIVRALQSAYGSNVQVQDLEAFGTPGLEALAASVKQQQQHKRPRRPRPSRTIHVDIPHHSTEFNVKWKLGESLLDVAQVSVPELLSEYMEGTCGGQMSCCTCHVYLDETTYAALEPPCENELDMLDLAFDFRQEQSRLGCQVRLSENLIQKLGPDHCITVTIPAGVNNVWK